LCRALTQIALLLAAVFSSSLANAVQTNETTSRHVGSPDDELNLADLAENQRWKLLVENLSRKNVNQLQADSTSALHWAVRHQHQSTIEKLINAGADIDRTNDYRVSALSLACELGHEGAARYLIHSGADLESKRIGGETPIMLAARNGNPAIVKALIAAGADTNAKENGGQTALMWAAAAGNLKAVNLLIEAKADLNHTLKKTGFTAFMFAARHGRTKTAKRLLDAGVDINGVLSPKNSSGRNPRKGMSALLLAIESGHFELALNLVEWGADPNDLRSSYGPLHAVTWVRKTKLGDDPAGDPPPRGSGSVHSLEFVREMIKRGANVNLQLNEGSARGKAKMNTKSATPFLMASQTADVPLMKLLLEHGADPTINNADDCTPLIACAGIGAVAVGEEPGTETEVNAAIKILVESCQLDVNAVDKNGETAMHGAAYRNYPETVRVLKSYGADAKIWNRKNKFQWTPFDIARGKRPGSLKPSPQTLAALREAVDTQTPTNNTHAN
jgi:ankyrin repeat protein